MLDSQYGMQQSTFKSVWYSACGLWHVIFSIRSISLFPTVTCQMPLEDLQTGNSNPVMLIPSVSCSELYCLWTWQFNLVGMANRWGFPWWNWCGPNGRHFGWVELNEDIVVRAWQWMSLQHLPLLQATAAPSSKYQALPYLTHSMRHWAHMGLLKMNPPHNY